MIKITSVELNKKYLVIVAVVVLFSGLLVYLLISTGKIKAPLLTQETTEVELRTEYNNPFDKNTQYVNPFEEYKSPLTSLQ